MGFEHETVGSVERYRGPIFDVVTDEVTMSDGGTAKRDVVRNKGAVVVVALDDDGRVVLIKQYRHALGARIWELPAGLRDVDGEDPALTAARELAEEADLTAGRMEKLVEVHTSPGFSTEHVLIYLARDLAAVPDAERFARHDEEADLEVIRIGLDEAVAMVLRGEITNAAAVAGLLAAARTES
ncbi:NUDIX hydrolase [Actinoplanes sp. L3-i22]|uniref:NUDIX domain-containing protein n=1 Tax=Actinoplanes sp. L3-i22 TaxID=2836373 RepID=UPI001C77B792|nr:NUDIX hydrolase [Actinoplanes sp. L3-i22]BCY13519.1 ADP-ribose pyrophosphatase [Actinoplanes sp. L3-i22]